MAAPKCQLCHVMLENEPSYQYRLASGETYRVCVACHLTNVEIFDPGQHILVQLEQQGLQQQIATVEHRMIQLVEAQARLEEERRSLVHVLVAARKSLVICTGRVETGVIAQAHPLAQATLPRARADLLAFLLADTESGLESCAHDMPALVMEKIARLLLYPTNMHEELKNCATIMQAIDFAEEQEMSGTQTIVEINHHFEMVEGGNHEFRCVHTTQDQCDNLAEVLDLHDHYVQKSLRHAVFGYDFEWFPLSEKKPFVRTAGGARLRNMRPRFMPPFYETACSMLKEHTAQLVTLRPSAPLALLDTGLLVRIIAVVTPFRSTSTLDTLKIEPESITPAIDWSTCTTPPNFDYKIETKHKILLYIYNVSDDDLLLQADSIAGTTTIENGSLITKKDADVVRHAVMADSFGRIANVQHANSYDTPRCTEVRDASGRIILTISLTFEKPD